MTASTEGLSPAFDAALLARVEAAGLDAAAPPQQQLLDGWVLRLSPGKAKRARCVNALAAGALPVDEMLRRAEGAYRAAGLPFIVRITPFTQPPTLDAMLAARGLRRFDDSRVMVRASLADLPAMPALPRGCRFEAVSPDDFAEAIGHLRDSPPAQRRAQAERLRQAPVPHQGWLLRDEEGLLACGQSASAGGLVGLYDIHTAAAQRGRGYARAMCLRLLWAARDAGGCSAYLQVDADNEPAKRLYAALGFVDAYGYHYRSRSPGLGQ